MEKDLIIYLYPYRDRLKQWPSIPCLDKLLQTKTKEKLTENTML